MAITLSGKVGTSGHPTPQTGAHLVRGSGHPLNADNRQTGAHLGKRVPTWGHRVPTWVPTWKAQKQAKIPDQSRRGCPLVPTFPEKKVYTQAREKSLGKPGTSGHPTLSGKVGTSGHPAGIHT